VTPRFHDSWNAASPKPERAEFVAKRMECVELVPRVSRLHNAVMSLSVGSSIRLRGTGRHPALMELAASARQGVLNFLLIGALGCANACSGEAAAGASSEPLMWPAITRQTRPWAYWWWMGSAVDETNLTRELQRYHEAGLGGIHIIPIYGAKGYENRYIDYLSPKWMEMLGFTAREAQRLDMGVDMTTGTGWCFGGPHVTDQEANASVTVKTLQVTAGSNLTEAIDLKAAQAVMAFSSTGECLDLTNRVQSDGRLDWSPPTGSWQVYFVSQRPSGQKVKRAAPGGRGHMLNLIYPEAMRHYLQWFDDAFRGYTGPKPRALYHDPYEYRSDWAPDFFCAIRKAPGLPIANRTPSALQQPRTGL